MPQLLDDPISRLATLVNQAWDARDSETLRTLINEADASYDATKSSLAKASIAFSRANAHSVLRQLDAEKAPQISWAWNHADLIQEVYWLRKALADISTEPEGKRNGDLEPRILTNLANAMSHIGRFCEALDYWDQAITTSPNFAMAIANRGDGLRWYARALYNGGHQTLFLWQSRLALTSGLSAGLESHAVDHARAAIAHLDTVNDWASFTYNLDNYPLGDTDAERQYRKWCLQNRLFLNPLNDLGPHNIGAQDVMTFPSISLPINKTDSLVPEVYGIYNQLVQEFVSARYIAYEALLERDRSSHHFSDEDVLLYDTLDYRVLCLWVEKLKMSYLSAFAMFDKMAYLLNHYLELGIPPNRVNFGSLWFNSCKPEKGVRAKLEASENWPLRGLFNLSRDLHWNADETFVMEPEAKTLHEIRRHIAHKYLTVHDGFCSAAGVAPQGQVQTGKLAMTIREDELAGATVKLLKLVRSAMIYLSLAANWQEQTTKKESDNVYAPMPLNPLRGNRQ